MAVLMEKVSSRERVQHLYNKNVELETKRRTSAQAKIPSDPNVWQRMRENFETIILEDHAFAEQHEIELALWQLHYKKIEELRANFNAAMAAVSSPSGKVGKAGSTRPDRVAKIRSQFKTFLSEATGFYHELILKIRANYGLPLDCFSDDTENEAALSKEENRSAELKKGLISCHRCLIYLGDLARYKGIYAEEESKLREFAAASGYYSQAYSFWPSSGNPHHQLAILATYSADEFLAIYRYFRSLAVENPFSMARDNLIIAFEKNRVNYSQLIGGAKSSTPKPVPVRMNGKGRARAEARFSGKGRKVEVCPVKERVTSTDGTIKTFSVKFVRLNGILFTRTSMETFADVLAMAKNDFVKLLSPRAEDDQSFGSDRAENELFIVRLVAILIFSVHNAIGESEDQSHAEILQRAVLLQNAYAAAYEFMGLIIESCLKLQDPLSSFLLPGVLVFVEWLACQPEGVNCSEEDKLAKIRAFFWKNCVSVFNKLVSSVLMDEGESCFLNMSKYEDSGTGNRLALWEDFELRGFLPLQPVQQILDFSRKHAFGVDGGNKGKKARVSRILAAAKSFSSVIRVGEQLVYFDSKLKKFAIGVEPQVSCDFALKSPETPQLSGDRKDVPVEKRMDLAAPKLSPQLFVDGEDEDEEIVYKPFAAADKITDASISALTPANAVRIVADSPSSDLGNYAATVAPAVASLGPSSFSTSATSSAPLYNGVAQRALPIQPNSSYWQLDQESSIMNGLRNLRLTENGNSGNTKLQEHYGFLQHPSLSQPFMHPLNSGDGIQPATETVMPSRSQLNLSSVYTQNGSFITPASLLPVGFKKSPVSRPLRHVGPPPGFTPPSKQSAAEMNMKDDDICLMDDYSWLDGYQMSSTKVSSGLINSCKLSGQTYNDTSKCGSGTGTVTFPFPGKQVSAFQVPLENPKRWQDYHFSQPLNLFQEPNQHLVQKGNEQAMPLQNQFQGQSLWEGHFLV